MGLERRFKLFSVRKVAGTFWPDPVHRQLVELLWRSIAVAVLALVLEIVVGHADPLGALEPEPRVAGEFLQLVLGAFAIPIAVLVGIWSVAIIAVGAYGDPALLLIHRLYPRGAQRVMAFVSGRYNPFYRALFYSTALLSSLIVIAAADRLTVSAPLIPALAIIVILLVLDALSLLFFIYWALRLTRASDTIAATWEMGVNLLFHIARVGAHGTLTPMRRRPISPELHLATEEQEEFRSCLRAITLAGARAASSGQTAAAREAARALSLLATQHLGLVTAGLVPRAWRAESDADDFVLAEVIEGFVELLRVAHANHVKELESEISAELRNVRKHSEASATEGVFLSVRLRRQLEQQSEF